MLFLSYSHHDAAQVDALQAQLQQRGISIWRDLNDLLVGTNTEERIAYTLGSQAHGILLWLTDNAFASTFVIHRELIWAQQRRAQDARFEVIPIFVDGNVRATNERVRELTGWDIAQFNGVARKPDEQDISFLRRIAQRTLQTVMRRIGESNPDEIKIGVQSRKVNLPRDPQRHLLLDFNDLFEDEYTPKPNAWREIRAALLDLRNVLAAEIGLPRLFFNPNAHLTIGYLLGNVFDRQTGFPLSVNQQGTRWDADAPSSEAYALDVNPEIVLLVAREITLEVSLTLDLNLQVNQLVMQLPRPIQRRVRVRSRDKPFGYIFNATEAADIAQQLRNLLIAERAQTNYERVHLLSTIPWGLACWIGRLANAIGPLQLYEWNNQTHVYMSSIEIA